MLNTVRRYSSYFAVRQRQAFLIQVQRDFRRITGIRFDAFADSALQSDHRQFAKQRRQRCRGPDGIDLGQPRLQRFGSERVQRRLVRETREEIANQLGRAALDAVRLFREVLDDGPQVGLGRVRELLERAVGGPVRRNLRLREPAAVDVPEQVVLHTHGGVAERSVEARLDGRWPRAGRGRQRDRRTRQRMPKPWCLHRISLSPQSSAGRCPRAAAPPALLSRRGPRLR
jgi:hypothetical protein